MIPYVLFNNLNNPNNSTNKINKSEELENIKIIFDNFNGQLNTLNLFSIDKYLCVYENELELIKLE